MRRLSPDDNKHGRSHARLRIFLKTSQAISICDNYHLKSVRHKTYKLYCFRKASGLPILIHNINGSLVSNVGRIKLRDNVQYKFSCFVIFFRFILFLLHCSNITIMFRVGTMGSPTERDLTCGLCTLEGQEVENSPQYAKMKKRCSFNLTLQRTQLLRCPKCFPTSKNHIENIPGVRSGLKHYQTSEAASGAERLRVPAIGVHLKRQWRPLLRDTGSDRGPHANPLHRWLSLAILEECTMTGIRYIQKTSRRLNESSCT